MMEENYLDKRFDLIKKQDEDRSYEPSEKEIEEAYGYLDYCISCGKKIRFLESFNHGFEGNFHKFGCSYLTRTFGLIYGLGSLIITFILLIIISPFYFGYVGIKKLVSLLTSKEKDK